MSKLTSILKIADACVASHKERAKTISCKIKDGELVVACDCAEDMTFEKWAFENRSVMFEDVMGVKPVLKTRREG